MLTPRPYISFSQMAKFEISPEKYAEEYIYKQKGRISRNMKYGSMLAESLEAEEASGDPLLDLMASRLPKFELMDKVIEDDNGKAVWYEIQKRNVWVPVLEDRIQNIPLLAKPDTAKEDYSAFKEYKTSTRTWTQKMADDSGQISFYATAIWLKTGRIPRDIELVDIVVDYDENGALAPTGKLIWLSTRRTMADIIKMTGRIRYAWKGIKNLCEKELL